MMDRCFKLDMKHDIKALLLLQQEISSFFFAEAFLKPESTLTSGLFHKTATKIIIIFYETANDVNNSTTTTKHHQQQL